MDGRGEGGGDGNWSAGEYNVMRWRVGVEV